MNEYLDEQAASLFYSSLYRGSGLYAFAIFDGPTTTSYLVFEVINFGVLFVDVFENVDLDPSDGIAN